MLALGNGIMSYLVMIWHWCCTKSDFPGDAFVGVNFVNRTVEIAGCSVKFNFRLSAARLLARCLGKSLSMEGLFSLARPSRCHVTR